MRLTHYSRTELEGAVVRGSRRGESGIGHETARVRYFGAPAGAYFVPEGQTPEPLIASRPFVYCVDKNFKLANVQNFATNETVARYAGLPTDEFLSGIECEILRAGFDGYYNEDFPNAVFLFGDTPVERIVQ